MAPWLSESSHTLPSGPLLIVRHHTEVLSEEQGLALGNVELAMWSSRIARDARTIHGRDTTPAAHAR